jgi:hypothetical protein
MHLESENSLILGVFTLRVSIPEISAETGLNGMITRTHGPPASNGWLEWAFLAIYSKTGVAEQMPSFVFDREGLEMFFFLGLNPPAGIFSLEYFHGSRCPGNVSQGFFRRVL